MASRRATFPTTGPRAGDHEDAKRLQRQAADDLAGVAAAKRQAATRDPGADTSAEHAKRRPSSGFDQLHGSRRNGAT